MFVTPVNVVSPLVIELVRATVTAPVDALALKFAPAVNEVTAEPLKFIPVNPEPSPEKEPVKVVPLTLPTIFKAPVIEWTVPDMFTEPVNW